MGFSRFAIEKKQVSTDRGVTWEDVTPSETRNGRLIGVASTLIECEDLDCDLEKYDVILVDGEMPDSFCTHPKTSSIGFTVYDTLIPSGLIKSIQFTDGMQCCINAWGTSVNKINDEYYGTSWTTPTANISPSRYYNTFHLDGREMESGGFCGEPTCFTVTEFMPWIQAGDTIKMAYKVKYVREHCSNEWELDEEFEPEFYTIGERWAKVYEDETKTTWQHQVAKSILFEGFSYTNGVPFQVVWENEGEPFDYYYDTEIPEDVEIIDEIRADGIAYNKDGGILAKYQTFLKINPQQYGGAPSGMIAQKLYHYMNDNSGCTWGFYNYDYEGERKYYLEPSCDYGTQLVENELTPVNVDKYNIGAVNSNYASMFCGIWVSTHSCGRNCYYNETTAQNILNHIHVGRIIKFDSNEVLFPYKVPSRNGWNDDYLNASEYGYISRSGNKIPLEYINGKYTNTNGVTQNIANNANTSLSIPSDAVDVVLADSITTIPNGLCQGNTVLSSITLNNVSNIGESAFKGCGELQSVTFGKPNTTLGDNSFEGSGLRSVSLQNVSTFGTAPSGINVGYVFRQCTNLQTVDIGTSVRYIPIGAFYNCTSLTSVTIPLNVSVIGSNAFYNCSSLSSLTISEGVVSIGNSCFNGCTSLTSVTIPSSVESYGSAFWNCSSLEYVTINTTANIEEYTFYGCNIKEVILTVTTPPVCYNGRYTWDRFFTFADGAVILVPASAVDAYKNDTHQGSWRNVASMIYPIPSETRWVNIGYTCVDGQKYDYERKQGRNTDYSNDWFDLPEYRTVGEPYGECTEGEFD